MGFLEIICAQPCYISFSAQGAAIITASSRQTFVTELHCFLVLHEYMKGQHSARFECPGRFCELHLSHRAKVQHEAVMVSATLL